MLLNLKEKNNTPEMEMEMEQELEMVEYSDRGFRRRGWEEAARRTPQF